MAIKILIGGSPCTYWSIAQTNNRETKAEGMGWELFKNYLIAKEKFKPDYFLYENNKSAAQAIKDQIAEEFGVGVDPKVRFTYINSALVSAQNRQRFYVTNFGDIEQPEDRGILLKDILEGAQPRYEKSPCVDANYYKGGNLSRPECQSGQRLMACEPVNVTPEGKSQTIKAQYQNTSVANVCCYHSTYGATGVAEPICHIIPQEVRVRKYTCDIAKFQDCLRENKTLTNKEIAEALDKPLTEVEHWFRKDKYFNIPDAEIWFDLKKLLNIETSEYDDFVTVFEVREGVFEKSHRCYDADGKMSTLLTSSNDNVIMPIRVGALPRPNGELSTSQAMQIYSQDGKSVTQMAGGGGLGGKTGLYAIRVDEPMRIKEAPKQGYVDINVGDCVDLAQPNSKTRRGRSLTEKSNCLTTSNQQYEYCGVLGFATPVEWDENGVPTKAISYADGKTYPVYEVKDGQITIKDKQYPIKLVDGYYIIRKLTVTECARLQTMPDDYCKAVSDSQAYKALGNGWTAEVIIHLLNHALKDVPRDEEIVVLSMYDGIATGRYCLDKMGFTNVTYHAYEIDKYPIQVAMDNYPDIIQHGDAFAVREDDWQPPQTRSEWLDELLGGDL